MFCNIWRQWHFAKFIKDIFPYAVIVEFYQSVAVIYGFQYFCTEFATTDEFVELANEMQTNTRYKKDMEFVATDRIITLSTCTNRSVDGRYALQAKLVQVIH